MRGVRGGAVAGPRFVEVRNVSPALEPALSAYDYKDAVGSPVVLRRFRVLRRGEVPLVGKPPQPGAELMGARSRQYRSAARPPRRTPR